MELIEANKKEIQRHRDHTTWRAQVPPRAELRCVWGGSGEASALCTIDPCFKWPSRLKMTTCCCGRRVAETRRGAAGRRGS